MYQKPQIIRERYKIVHEIARGGMGIVYFAKDLLTNNNVALKTSTLASEQKTREAFEIEAKLLARLSHPGLPKVRDYFLLDDNYQALVMDFVEGETLSELLESGRHRIGPALDPKLVIGWSLQILDILSYLHGFSPPVIHRDIKPNNLKLKPDGTIVLLDFGLAKGSMMSVISGGSGYSSLEQLNMAATDPRSDLYAFAATIYHLLTNYAPLNAMNRFQAVCSGKFQDSESPNDKTAVNTDPQKLVSDINPHVPAEISAIIMKAMSIMPEDRFQSANEMKKALLIAGKNPVNTFVEYRSYDERPQTNDEKHGHSSGRKSLLDEEEENFAVWSAKKNNEYDSTNEHLPPVNNPATPPIDKTQLSFQKYTDENPASFQYATGDDFTTFQVPSQPGKSPAQKVVKKAKPLLLGALMLLILSLTGLGAWYFLVSKSQKNNSAGLKNGLSPVAPAADADKKRIEVSIYSVKKDGKETRLEEDHLFEDDEQFRFGLKSDAAGYLYVISRNNQDKAQLAYPKPDQVDNSIKKNTESEFPPEKGKFAFNQNSPSEMWAYFVVVASRENELAKRIRTVLGNNQEKSLSLPEVDKLMKDLDEIAENSAQKHDEKTDSTDKQSVVITKLQKKK